MQRKALLFTFTAFCGLACVIEDPYEMWHWEDFATTTEGTGIEIETETGGGAAEEKANDDECEEEEEDDEDDDDGDGEADRGGDHGCMEAPD